MEPKKHDLGEGSYFLACRAQYPQPTAAFSLSCLWAGRGTWLGIAEGPPPTPVLGFALPTLLPAM